MAEGLSQTLTILRKEASLKYVDSKQRQRILQILNNLNDQNSSSECIKYFKKIQQLHDNYMNSVTIFLDSLTIWFSQQQHQQQLLQIELSQGQAKHKQQKIQWQKIQSEMINRIYYLQGIILQKQEEYCHLQSRLEQKQIYISSIQKQNIEELRHLQQNLQKQQKALEEAYSIITNLQSQIQRLSIALQQKIYQITKYKQQNSQKILIKEHDTVFDQKSPSKLKIQFHEYQINSQQNRIIKDNSLKFINSQISDRQQDILKEMLNISQNKHSKQRLNKSLQKSKQNIPFSLNYFADSIQTKHNLLINQSIQQWQKITIPAFQMQNIKNQQKIPSDPYYSYFLIASQNVKIRSKYFQKLSQVDSKPIWSKLIAQRIALHQWQKYINNQLLKLI